MSNKTIINIPDIGGAAEVDVIEILVKPGDVITVDQSLITLEGDKATMDIPSTVAGVVEALMVKVGDKVSQGTPVLSVTISDQTASKASEKEVQAAPKEEKAVPAAEITQVEEAPLKSLPPSPEKAVQTLPQDTTHTQISAGPAVRRLAREFGIDLSKVAGHGRKNRIMLDDLKAYAKSRMAGQDSAGGSGIPQMPSIDFSQFGEVEIKALNKIKRLTGINLHRAWVNVPHVTQFDEADITDLEAFRKQEAGGFEAKGYKLTLLAFVTKAICHALQAFPQFNASLDPTGVNLIYKKYVNVGIAVETPNGLVVPVIKNADQLSVAGIAEAMSTLSQKARQKGLTSADMSGGCFTISSLGGIGGTAFTPIVNAPEVAILGLSRSSMKPVYQQGVFVPRLMLPLSLSYDHRVIDGAEAARFTQHLVKLLSDIRRVMI